MKRWMWIPALLALALTACGRPAAKDEGVGSTDQPVAARAVGTPGEVAPTEPASPEVSGPPGPGTVVATAQGPTPTMDPTREAFYNSFRLASKGDENAPVSLFEFSDYL